MAKSICLDIYKTVNSQYTHTLKKADGIIFFMICVWLTSTFYVQSEKLIPKVFYCLVFACFILLNKKY